MASVSAQLSNDNESPTSSANDMKSRRETQRKMMDDCVITWQHIQDIHHRLASYKEDKPPNGTEKINATLKILEHKEKRLKAQLDILKQRDVEVTLKDTNFVEMLLRSDTKKSIEQLKATLVILKEQRLEVAGDIASEKKLLEVQKAIQQSLEEKVQACQEEETERKSQNSVLSELQEKKKEANKHHLNIMKQLGKFLSNHFPKPDDDDDSDSEEENSRHGNQYCSLQHIIETLMNRLFESPHDSYVEILPRYWPPYIELLLRSNIIQRHSDNCNLIRLVAFHC